MAVIKPPVAADSCGPNQAMPLHHEGAAGGAGGLGGDEGDGGGGGGDGGDGGGEGGG